MEKADTYTVPVDKHEFLWPAWLGASLGNSDSVFWADLLGLIRHLFTLSALPAQSQAFCLSENLPLNMGVKVVPKIFGADGPKITQRPPRALEHIIIR